MKRSVWLSILIIAVLTSGSATQNKICRWENKKVTVTLIDNYGTPMGEEIMAQNQREKAYYIFNFLSDVGENINLEIYPSAVTFIEKPKRYSVGSLNVEEIEKTLGLRFSQEEKYCPVYDEEKLLYLNWRGNLLELKSDGLSVFHKEEAFNFFGKQKDNILIRVKGKLMYLDEADWLPVETLKDFTVSNIFKWHDNNTVISYVERDIDGKRFIAIASIRKPEIELLPDVTGTLINIAVSSDKNKVCSLHFKEDCWRISEYSKKENKWVLKNEFKKKIDLIDIRKNKIICWDRDEQRIFIPGGTSIGNIRHLILKTYPEGKYVYGETEDALVPVRALVKVILFYDNALQEKLLKIGFRRIEKFDGNPEVWLLPVNYMSDISSLSDDPGHVFFSIDNMRIYYDTIKRNIRNIESIKLKPTVKERNILIFLGVLLLVLLAYELTKKAKEFTTK